MRLPIILLLFGFCFIASCSDQEKCNFYYKDLIINSCVNGTIISGMEDGRFIFYDTSTRKEFLEAGFYKDGFRDNLWSYNYNKKIKQITWVHYKDKDLGFETNIFSYVDSIIHRNFSSLLIFPGDTGKIKLSITLNSPLKDSALDKNHKRIMENEFSLLGAKMENYSFDSLSDGINKVYINSYKLIAINKAPLFIEGAFAYLGSQKTFIDFSVACSTGDFFLSKKLFNAVLTNFYYEKYRLFNPFRK